MFLLLFVNEQNHWSNRSKYEEWFRRHPGTYLHLLMMAMEAASTPECCTLPAMSSRRWHSRTTCSTLLTTTRILFFDFAAPFEFPTESSAIIKTLAFFDLLWWSLTTLTLTSSCPHRLPALGPAGLRISRSSVGEKWFGGSHSIGGPMIGSLKNLLSWGAAAGTADWQRLKARSHYAWRTCVRSPQWQLDGSSPEVHS